MRAMYTMDQELPADAGASGGRT